MIKNNLLLRYFPLFFGKLTLFLLFTSLSDLSYSQDFEVGPVKLNYECEPGQIETKIMTVRNHANEKQQFTLIIADMKLDTTKKPNSAGTTTNRSCKDWITVNPSFFDINPNETKEIKVVMQVPPGETNTRGAMIYVSATEEQTAFGADKQMKSAIKVKPRIGVKVVQSPKSNTNYKGTVTNLKEITQAKDTVRTFQAQISNAGDKVFEGKLFLVLSNLETAKEIKQKPQKVSLFPGMSKTMTLYLPKLIPTGKYSLAAILDYGHNSPLEAAQMNIVVK